MVIEGRKLYFCFTLICYLLTFCLFTSYLFFYDIRILLISMLFLFISNILFCFNNIRYYIVHLFFYLTVFIFLSSRPTIDYIKTGILDTYQREAYIFAFGSVSISLFCIFVGGILAVKIFGYKHEVNKQYNNDFIKSIRLVSFLVFCISYPFYFIRLVERLNFRLSTTYYDYYANFESQLPYITYIISTFMLYSMCLYLATKPTKIMSNLVLILFVLANSIHLFIGTRNPFILSLIFSFIYYFIRNQDEKGTWIGFKEKVIVFLSTPILVLTMGMLNYLRDDKNVQLGVLDLFVDFIYKQGTSFGVLARGYLYNSNLPYKDFQNFTFGPVIEYFYRGNLGNNLFDTKPFENTTNSIELAYDSNSYAHNISFVVLREDYLNGHGIGGSYIMDVFTDFGFIGLIIFSIFIGFLFVLLVNSSYINKTLFFAISLLILNNIFFMPRSSSSESFFSLFTFQFWFIIILIYFLSYLLTIKNYSIHKEIK